jgi:2-polyprenyl-3-methyl-5-hydroxy-6-metoxy-1,4-benzoquinol methylase
MARQSIAVTGIDTSRPMLKRAQSRTAHEGVGPTQIRWCQADVTQLALDERFGLAVFDYIVFMHLLEQ